MIEESVRHSLSGPMAVSGMGLIAAIALAAPARVCSESAFNASTKGALALDAMPASATAICLLAESEVLEARRSAGTAGPPIRINASAITSRSVN